MNVVLISKSYDDLIQLVAKIREFHLELFSANSRQGPLAQSVERGADNAEVVSSRLTWTTFFQNSPGLFFSSFKDSQFFSFF